MHGKVTWHFYLLKNGLQTPVHVWHRFALRLKFQQSKINNCIFQFRIFFQMTGWNERLIYHFSLVLGNKPLYSQKSQNFSMLSGGTVVPPALHPVETATKSYSSQQDLPNNMIHQVPIKSLPQEWLWCETWCDDSSKKRAKTIDLVSTVWLPHSYVK